MYHQALFNSESQMNCLLLKRSDSLFLRKLSTNWLRRRAGTTNCTANPQTGPRFASRMQQISKPNAEIQSLGANKPS